MSRPQKSEAAANADDEESFSSERKSFGYYYYGTCGLCFAAACLESNPIWSYSQHSSLASEVETLLVGLTQKNGEREKRGGSTH